MNRHTSYWVLEICLCLFAYAKMYLDGVGVAALAKD